MKEDIIEYKDYTGTVHFSSDDKVFHGKIFGINDLVTFEGETVDELINSFHDAVDDYILTCNQIKKKPEKSFKGSFNVRVPSDVHKDAALLATKENISLNEYVKRVLTFAVNNPEIK
ncbi:type II toxin-antitoxin system HicB family antitoxin [soil metagenome]